MYSKELKMWAYLHLRAPRSHKFGIKYIRQKKKYDPDKQVMAWAAITQSGERKIAFIDGKINSEAYINILKDNLLDM
jgi:hypothetical protein